MMDMEDPGSVLARLEQVERRCRRWRRASLACLVGSALVVAGGAAFNGVPAVVEAERFVVRDKNGEDRVNLGQNAVGDKNELTFFDPGLKKRLSVSVRTGGEAWVEFFDSNGAKRLSVGVGADRVSGIRLFDENERERLSAVANPDGSGGFNLLSAEGKTQATLSSWPDGAAGLVLGSQEGKERARLTIDPAGKPMLQLRDTSDKVFFQSTQQ